MPVFLMRCALLFGDAAFALGLASSAAAGICRIFSGIRTQSGTERTREIGVRMAIGALEREVLLQFLIEAVVLSALGGVVGIVVAFAACYGVTSLMGMPFLFDPWVNLMAFLFSAAIGVVFGYAPARRAARLNPIGALRHE